MLKNAHGDTVRLVRNGSVLDSADYDPYGKYTDWNSYSSYSYANYYYDSYSGFYYLRNRFYDPNIGKFISEDPVHDGMNWYAYCSGNPIMFVDPSGLFEENDKKLDSDDYAKILVLTELYNYYYDLEKYDYAESCRKEAVEIRQQSKYSNIYNKGTYKDNYKYIISNNTTAVNVEVLSDGMAWILGGKATSIYQESFDLFMDNLPEFDRCLSMIFSVAKTYVDSTKYYKALDVLRGGDIEVSTGKTFSYGYTKEFGLPSRESAKYYFKRSGEIIAFETHTTYYKYGPMTPEYNYTRNEYHAL